MHVYVYEYMYIYICICLYLLSDDDNCDIIDDNDSYNDNNYENHVDISNDVLKTDSLNYRNQKQ
jgi:hypothetical protein